MLASWFVPFVCVLDRVDSHESILSGLFLLQVTDIAARIAALKNAGLNVAPQTRFAKVRRKPCQCLEHLTHLCSINTAHVHTPTHIPSEIYITFIAATNHRFISPAPPPPACTSNAR